MNNELYEQSKQAVAVRHGYENWDDLFKRHPWPMDPVYQDVSDLYAQSVANEAVKADRSFVIDQMVSSETTRVIHKQVALKLPLPFPEQQKEYVSKN